MTATAWDALHQQARHRLEYPSEHVVRFLAGVELDPDARHHALAVDIGCGSGRHAQLLTQFGFQTSACDVSDAAVKTTRKMWSFAPRFVEQAPMTALPYGDDLFDVALAYGVFYYGTLSEHSQAVMEMHRVLRPGGQGFVCVRTTDDWRATTPAALKGEPEDGMLMHFLYEEDIAPLYGVFSEVTYERTETTTGERTRTNSDWLLTVRK